MEKRIPILLITGFLGSGKTTFINWLMHTHPEIKISLILNEFGDIKLESQFIKADSGVQIVELANGCMCCVAKSDIPRVLNLILEQSPQTQYIVIEASGLSDPDPIREVLQESELTEKVVLQSTVCIVDTLNFEKTREDHAIIMSQVGDADVIILSKVKEAGEQITSRIKQSIENIGIKTKVLVWDESLTTNLFLLNPVNVDKAKEDTESEDHEHHHEHEHYDEFWFKSDKPIDVHKLVQIMETLPQNIIRSKGYINSEGKKLMIQYVAHKLETYESEWNNETPNSVVLFLGKEINTEQLKKILTQCEI